ncbi:BnaA02g26560D [Brassica napus]|uniref:BnaA02g26560D protein n=1 Tax=Brassica napus TaxID=3708 RepID=A0A078F8J7_BRANA|nr:BnaA02g26560D [Brassica napus]
MGKTPSPGKWIKSLLGKKSSKSSLEKGTVKLRSANKEEIVVKVKDTNVSDLPTNLPVLVSSQEVAAATQAVIVPDVVVPEKQPSEELNVNLESGNDTEELKLEEAATKVQAAVRSHQVTSFSTFQ